MIRLFATPSGVAHRMSFLAALWMSSRWLIGFGPLSLKTLVHLRQSERRSMFHGLYQEKLLYRHVTASPSHLLPRETPVFYRS